MNAKPAATLFAERFDPIEEVGSGGMGTVFRCWDRLRSQWVALKVLACNPQHSAEVERFVREAKLLSELQHPGIVRYVDHGEGSDGRPYLVMEWLEGEDLSQRLRRGPLPLAQAMTLLRRVCSALSVAHDAGVVHREPKI
jgi:serine/threonine protein kinase